MKTFQRNLIELLCSMVVCFLFVSGYSQPQKPIQGKEEGKKEIQKVEAGKQSVAKEIDTSDLSEGTYAVMKTSMGTVVLKLFTEKVPKTCENFIGLAEGTKEWTDPNTGQKVKKPLYDGLTFHRVIDGFMIQGGCPLGTGNGGPGYTMNDEVVGLKHDKPGILSMARTREPNSQGCQFYITVAPQPHLDRDYTIFGEVVKGMDTVIAISKVGTGSANRPLTPVIIEKVSILRIPKKGGEPAKITTPDTGAKKAQTLTTQVETKY